MGSGRGSFSAAATSADANSDAVQRSSESGRPPRSRTEASDPMSAVTGINLPTRAARVDTVESPANGTFPVIDSIRHNDRAYTSVLASTSSPRACSGDAYRATWVATVAGSSQASAPSSCAIATSTTRRRASSPNTSFDGVSSVCTTPRPCAASSARQASRPTTSAWDGASSRPRSNRSRRLPPPRYSTTQNTVDSPSRSVSPQPSTAAMLGCVNDIATST